MDMHHHQAHLVQEAHQHHHPETLDYGTVKHLLSEAELQQQQQQLNLASTESTLLAAQSQHDAAKAVYDESALKVERLKSQFRDQIMDEGLRQSCRWNDMYYKLVEWKEGHNGDTTVPCDPKSSEDVKKLNRWVINQRTGYKYFMNGDKKHIKDHRIDALNKVSRGTMNEMAAASCYIFERSSYSASPNFIPTDWIHLERNRSSVGQ